MVLANVATLVLCNLHQAAVLLFQEPEIGWDPIHLWKQMGVPAKLVVIILFLMSGWSIGIMIDRWMNSQTGGGSAEEDLEASRRALERAEAIVHAELKRGLAGLATIGSTAPFVGLFGTVIGIINAFREMSGSHASGLTVVAGGISEALVTTAIGLFVAVPAVWMFNYFTGRVEGFDVEMENSSSELLDYFLKRRNGGRR